MDEKALKIEAARAALGHVSDGMRLGIGTGTTAAEFVRLLAEKVAGGMKIIGVPTSERTAALCEELGVPLSSLEETPELDLTVDGADLERIGGVWVTSEVRTLVDLARTGDDDHARAARLLSHDRTGLIAEAIDRLEAGVLPHKRAALVFLRGLAAAEASDARGESGRSVSIRTT